jgi:hypothetical protein
MKLTPGEDHKASCAHFGGIPYSYGSPIPNHRGVSHAPPGFCKLRSLLIGFFHKFLMFHRQPPVPSCHILLLLPQISARFFKLSNFVNLRLSEGFELRILGCLCRLNNLFFTPLPRQCERLQRSPSIYSEGQQTFLTI